MATMIANILSDTEKSVTAAIAVEKAAADATKAHTQQLKQAMEVSVTIGLTFISFLTIY